MKIRSFATALALSSLPAAVMSFSAPAQAQSASDDASTKAARARFQEGVDFFDKGQFENARASFLQAYALRKHPAVLLNLAQSSLRSNHPLEASRFFQQFLREAQNITQAQRDTCNSGLAEARARLGRIDVSAPTAAEISVDGERIGSAPLDSAVDVEPGTHVVKARTTEGREESQSVAVATGQKASARFGANTPPPPVAAPLSVAPVDTSAQVAVPPPPPAVESAPPASDANAGAATPSRPRHLTTWAPVWIGAGVAVAGGITAIVFASAKSSAQKNADSVEAAIVKSRNEEGLTGKGACVSPTSKYTKACSALSDNRSTVNTDATLANIGLGVGIAGGVLAVGWLLLGPRTDDGAPTPTTGIRSLKPAPIIGRETNGFSLSGAF